MKIAMIGGAFTTLLMSELGEGSDLGGATARIRPDLTGYQTAKSASGSSTKICGDEVSLALVGATLDETYDFVSKVVGVAEADLREKYGDKNPGQQRMFLGNLIRGAYNGKDKERAARVKASFDAELADFRELIDMRAAEEAEKREAEKAEKAAERERIKAEKKAERERVKAEKAAERARQAADRAAAKAPAQPPVAEEQTDLDYQEAEQREEYYQTHSE